jgi:Bacterial DNA polymerase III alpha NTPase domain
VVATLKHELQLDRKSQIRAVFSDGECIVRFARSQNILCQGRGSAANSAVCYVLGITSIDPGRNDLLFERFVSEERREPPDIDVDFEHERREIVMQWVFKTYGRDHAALCSTVRQNLVWSARRGHVARLSRVNHGSGPRLVPRRKVRIPTPANNQGSSPGSAGVAVEV